MQIILLETQNKLGKAGEIVTVKDGFARNYLIPQKKAVVANLENKKNLEARMEQINENNENKISEASLIKTKLDGNDISIEMEANEENKLYGNINQKHVIEEIKSKFSQNLSSDNIITGSIKTLGDHEITIRLYDNISAKMILTINRKSKQ